jgi:HlyD family secretion protein
VRKGLRATWWTLAGVGAALLLVWAFWPVPVEVDVAEVQRGPMQVTVDQEGRTRVRQRYVVSAPVPGQLQRIRLKEGDEVVAGQTLLATIQPSYPSPLDVRTREEAEARVRAAEAAVQQAAAGISRAEAELDFARLEHERVAGLHARRAASDHELNVAMTRVAVTEAELRMMTHAHESAQHQLQQAKAMLLQWDAALADGGDGMERPAVAVRSPADGRVLRIVQESEAAVQAGQSLVEIGNPHDLEVVIDVLSRDAVQVQPGAAVTMVRWGGAMPLPGRVRRVEPSGFTKISALGVEEQRVNVIVDLEPETVEAAGLADGYRVDARIVVWEQPDAVKVPTGALLRHQTHWAVFTMTEGRAVLRTVELGRMNHEEAEVLDGLSPGERVILHPSDQVRDGIAAAARQQ